MNSPRPDNDSYDSHARSCHPDDIWAQVKRTVRGKPLPDADIRLIVDSVCGLLALSPTDILLDLCCGNGALSHQWFSACAAGEGVDASPYLIDIANARFVEKNSRFVQSEALTYVLDPRARKDFTKAVCYGSLQYFSRASAVRLLTAARDRLPDLCRIVIGNIPDLERAPDFFGTANLDPEMLSSPLSALGVWYSAREFTLLAEQAGWQCQLHRMPEGFHAAHYRFDAILVRAEESGK